MRKRYKIILNVEITDPDKPYPAGGSYTHDSLLEGVLRSILWANRSYPPDDVKVTLDKMIDKGEIIE